MRQLFSQIAKSKRLVRVVEARRRIPGLVPGLPKTSSSDNSPTHPSSPTSTPRSNASPTSSPTTRSSPALPSNTAKPNGPANRTLWFGRTVMCRRAETAPFTKLENSDRPLELGITPPLQPAGSRSSSRSVMTAGAKKPLSCSGFRLASRGRPRVRADAAPISPTRQSLGRFAQRVPVRRSASTRCWAVAAGRRGRRSGPPRRASATARLGRDGDRCGPRAGPQRLGASGDATRALTG